MLSNQYDEYRELMSRGAFRQAAELAEREALDPSRKTEFWLTQQARALLRLGEPKVALDCAKRAVALAPRNSYAILACADAERECGDHEGALADYRSLSDDTKVGERAREGALACLADLRRWEDLLAGSTSTGARAERAYQWRALALAGLGKRDEAIEVCRSWLEADTGNPRAHWKLTELEIDRDGLEQVRLRMGRMAKIPNQPPIYGEIFASLCRRAGMEDCAVGQYEKLAARSGDIRIARKQAFAMAKSGREDEAIPILEEVLRTDPKDAYAHTSYGAACRRAGTLERADTFYTELLGRFPSEGGLYGWRKKIRATMEKQA